MQITREGKGLLLTTVLVGLAALNTGNNLIYLLLSLMVSLIVADFLAGYRNLGKLVGHAGVDGPVHATQPAGLTFRVRNTRKRRPAFLIGAEWPAIDAKAMLPRIDPGSQGITEAIVRFPKRGFYQLQDGRLFSAYPFGFFRFQSAMPDARRILVYPALIDVRAILSRISHSGGSGVIPFPGGDDFTDLRPYRPGDRMKDIHWKATAKTGDMVIREYRAGISHKVNLILDTAPGGPEPDFERGVSLAASIALQLIAQGLSVRLTTGTTETGYCGNKEAACRILDELAVVRPDARTCVPAGPVEGAINILVLIHSGSSFAALQSNMTETIHVHSV